MTSKNLGNLIDSQKVELAELIVAEQWSRNVVLAARYGSSGRSKCVDGVTSNLSYLAHAVAADSTALFVNYIEWVSTAFDGLNIPVTELAESLSITGRLFSRNLAKDDSAAVTKYITAGIAAVQSEPVMPASFFVDENPLSDFARKYLSSLRNEDRSEASAMVLNAVRDGVSVKDIYLGVFEPSQREIGRLWQTNQMSVAEEHFCTAATQLVMSQLYPNIFNTEKNGRRMVAVCVGSELHEIGLHMVADIFEMEGWDTYHLGSNTPTATVVETIEARDPDILAISATMTFQIKAVVGMIAAIKNTFPSLRTKILVGGYPFNIDPDLWSKVGADGYARDAVGAVAVAGQLVGSLGLQ